jgi:hypothetical protein
MNYEKCKLESLKGDITWETRRRCEDNIKIYFKEIECEVVDYIHLAQEGAQWHDLVNTIINLQFHERQGIS